jgi:hypothetical protein
MAQQDDNTVIVTAPVMLECGRVKVRCEVSSRLVARFPSFPDTSILSLDKSEAPSNTYDC